MNPAPVLDLPQISIARYFDLLKRRRWQVIPVSLLGLLIGGVVAFFIPRYYVVETMIEYHRPPGDLNGRSVNPEDPFAPIVNNARYTLPLAAGATMKDLGWVEASEPDVSRLREIQRTVEQRIAITDVTPPKSQDYAQLLVSYRDRDGHRAANLLNTLVDKWRKVRLQDLQQRAEAQKREANNMVGDANSTYSQISANLEELSLKYGFQRSLAVELQRERIREEKLDLRDQKRRQEELVAKLARLDSEVIALNALRDRTLPFIEISDVDMEKRFPDGSPQRRDVMTLKAAQRSLEEVVGQAHPGRRAIEMQIAKLQAKLFEKVSGVGELRNPRVAELLAELNAKNADQAVAVKALETLVAGIRLDEIRMSEHAHAETQFIERMRDLELAKTSQESAQSALRDANTILAALGSEPPITFQRVGVPQHPTDPNGLLLALFGCLLGLSAAIGLILLIDILQGTFKTVDDVERALPIPVLGGMSHFETGDQLQMAKASRRRSSWMAAAVLGSAVIVVTIYYVAPERLPSAALNVLSLVLGK